LHHEARRFGDRARAEPPDRRSARRLADARESRRSARLPRIFAPADLITINTEPTEHTEIDRVFFRGLSEFCVDRMALTLLHASQSCARGLDGRSACFCRPSA